MHHAGSRLLFLLNEITESHWCGSILILFFPTLYTSQHLQVVLLKVSLVAREDGHHELVTEDIDDDLDVSVVIRHRCLRLVNLLLDVVNIELAVYFVIIALFELETPLHVRVLRLGRPCHGEVLLEGRQGHLLKVVKVVGFAQEIDWEESIHIPCGEFSSLLDMPHNCHSNTLHIDMRASPFGKFDENSTGHLHIEDIVHSIARFLDFCNFFIESSHAVLLRCLSSLCSCDFTAAFDFCALSGRLFYLLFLLLIILARILILLFRRFSSS